jgi:microcystin-dependent protein
MSGGIIDAETVFFTTPNPSLIGPLLDSIDIREGTFDVLNTTDINLTTPIGPTAGGTGLTTYATGDILYASAPNVLASLPIGAPGNALIAGAGTPAWSGSIGSPIGSMLIWPSATPPTNYLICDGQTLSDVIFADLFAVIGTSFGTGGPGTFNLPDLRQRIPIGQNTLGAAPFTAIGGTGGALTTTLAVANMPAHSHGINDPGHGHPFGRPAGGPVAPLITVVTYTNTPNPAVLQFTSDNTTGISVQSNGSGTAFDTYPPILTLNYIIKYA